MSSESPLLLKKQFARRAVFQPENLLSEVDFEKGEADGTVASLRLNEAVAQPWLGIANGTGPVKEQ